MQSFSSDEAEGRARVVIDRLTPEIDGGRSAAKAIIGRPFTVTAVAFADGHDLVAAHVRWRRVGASSWQQVRMQAQGNDRYTATFTPTELGRYEYTIDAWIDVFATWLRDARAFAKAGALEDVHLQTGAALLESEGHRALADRLRTGVMPPDDTPFAPRWVSSYPLTLTLEVERERALAGAWYELFPRSLGTFKDVEKELPAIAAMGFDVLYLPPIHPIGELHRKGKNNARTAAPGDVGSPWAIGSKYGGHTAIEPTLGTFADFASLVQHATATKIEIALDIAFQCAPDHPWVREHPAWFKRRPDGTIQYAENPPKKYEDIYPFDFESEDWRGLWQALTDVFLFWCKQGVRLFRVDNPHTKAFPFWRHCLEQVRRTYPDAVFLAEAFTRPGPMYHLAKIGFSQSYTYFTWRNDKAEIEAFMRELASVSSYYRPNLWPNTPDILTAYLQTGGRAAFAARLVLAATLAASYGIYGPAYENLEATPRVDGSEDYLDSEKYQVRNREGATFPLRPLITLINRIRREHPVLQSETPPVFYPTTNDQLIAYTRGQGSDTVLVIVNLDPHHKHSGFVDLSALDPALSLQAHDLLSNARYLWQSPRVYIELDPAALPAHVFALRHKVRSEHDFDYFL